MREYLGKRTLAGVLCAVGTLLLILCGGAFLLQRGILAESAAPYVACAGCLAAAGAGGAVAAGREDHRLIRAGAAGMLLYLLLWVAALLTGRPIRFFPDGLRNSAAILCGILANALLTPGKRNRKSAGKRQSSRRKTHRRPVT